ncbi:MAG: DUF1501 domain-containing protein, partial [Betaproteobacteria bacterium]|nr:DUF1501 domain-containing protein [Betaproteobacteria bacterium]
AAATTATMAMGAPRLLANEKIVHPKATADSCILIWMGGGMTHIDTFDPKEGATKGFSDAVRAKGDNIVSLGGYLPKLAANAARHPSDDEALTTVD